MALAAVLLSMAAMHAPMVSADGPGQHGPAVSVAAAVMPATVAQIDAGMTSGHAMGDMNLADCLLLGMVCFLTAVAVLMVAIVIGRLRRLLRPRAAAQRPRLAVRRLRPPEPPSLLVLSISRT